MSDFGTGILDYGHFNTLRSQAITTLTGTPPAFTFDSMDKVAEKLDHIGKALERHNEIVQTQLDLAKKPKNKAKNALEIIVLFTTALGVITIADIIRRWFTGG